ncbi:TonB-dependent receptor [Flavobacterium sp. JAS]|uniref:SusC/RagA family TonB-linked outer membrane protein n=1 Tax=Flavobacterium sp. JAS TaxID=2897329 RepID=UPI001E598C2F|nr:TonB-dependent receptor [Flavobacterium sp. JAS]MCD0472358.1 TonB-dependent receptor [Flavobacterium sp. JAS]
MNSQKIRCLKLFCIIFIMCSGFTIMAQELVCTGQVVDSEKFPLPGTTVSEKGTTNATITDIDGKFKITIKNGDLAVLKFTHMGMAPVGIKLNGQKVLNVTMKVSSDNALDEVVVVGYGKVKRKDVTGAIGSVSGEEISQVPVTNVIEALKGRIAGLVVSSSSGAQDSEISVRIRGGISITQDNSPLYIVDGFPMENGFVGINPNDVKSVDVLKDASATAIYGSRGANGVIIITTKEGTVGIGTITYDTYIGVKKISNRTPVLSPLEFVLYDYEKSLGGADWLEVYGPIEDLQKNYAGRKGVNWQDLLYDGKTAINQMQRIGFSGGSKENKYFISYTYNNDGNIVPDSGYSTHSIRLNSSQKISEKLTIGTNITFFSDKLRGVGPFNETGKALNQLIQFRPTAGINYSDEDLILNDIDPINDIGESVELNPLADVKTNIRNRAKKNYSFGFNLNYVLNNNFSYTFNFGFSGKQTESSTFFTSRSAQAKLSNGPYGSLSLSTDDNYFGNQTLTYKKTIGKEHSLDILIGQEIRVEKSKLLSVSAGGFPDDNFGVDYFNLATIPNLPTSGKFSNKLISFFGRANYKFSNKYILTATMRADGSTKFGANNKWGYFPSVAVAWLAGNEKFIDNLNVFSDLKFRLSYGASGNNRIDNYRSLSLYSAGWTPIDNGVNASFSPSLANPGLKWETNLSTNLGMDVSFFKNRLNATFDLYNIVTKDLLLETRIPLSSGYETALKNVGSTQSRGLEIGIQSFNIKNKNFTWTTNFNIAFNKTKILELANSDRWEISSGSGGNGTGTDFIIEKGGSVGKMWGLQYDGLYTTDDFAWDGVNSKWVLNDGIPVSKFYVPQPGVTKYKDISGANGLPDGKIDELDKTFIGNANPDFTGGLMNTFTYKNWDLSFFWEFKYGGDVYNANLYQLIRNTRNKSTTKDVFDKQYRIVDFQGNNLLDTGNIDALKAINANAKLPSQRASSVPFDSYMVEDGSYARLGQLTLGYRFSKEVLKQLKLNQFRLYATVYNPLTITKYSGYDPEVSMNSNGGITPGIDRGSHPRSESYVFGLSVSF